jgi:ABC-type antimicrobial peptide transport system permease subunit
MERGGDRTPAPWLTVIGIVGDVRTFGLETDARPEMYVHFRQRPQWTTSMTAIVRGDLPAAQLSGELRRRGATVDPQIALDIGTLDDRLSDTLATRVLTMSLLASFAAIALLLAAMGIYGVLSYAVAQRTRELALRSALGATRTRLVQLVLGAGLRVIAVGLIAGIAAAIALTRMLESMLVDIEPLDPWSYGAAIAVLLGVSLAAILVPAHRATRLDPMIALTAE